MAVYTVINQPPHHSVNINFFLTLDLSCVCICNMFYCLQGITLEGEATPHTPPTSSSCERTQSMSAASLARDDNQPIYYTMRSEIRTQ